MNSLNTQLGANSSFFQVDPGQNTQSSPNQGNQGISEKQLDQLLTQLIMALLQQSNNAEQGQGQGQGGDSGGQGGNPRQAGQSNGSPSQYTQALMNIVGDILQAQNGFILVTSLASDTGSMQ
uniref:HpaG_G n=1 Tax=Xanthomonas axonopodis TaxID=53413 RepID=A0MTG1_9XANT|nr:HpaG_G [Xanthomonas axonopodis]